MPDQGLDIDIGDLKSRVTWQTNAASGIAGSGGQKLNHWTSQGEYWASVQGLSGRELWTARQLQAATTLRILMRQVGPIKPGDRFILVDPLYGNRYLYVESCRRLNEQNEFLEIEASEPKDHT